MDHQINSAPAEASSMAASSELAISVETKTQNLEPEVFAAPENTADVVSHKQLGLAPNDAKPEASEIKNPTSYQHMFQGCLDSAEDVRTAGVKSADALFEHLSHVYRFVGKADWSNSTFKKFCRSVGLPCTNASRKNPYIAALMAASRLQGLDAKQYRKKASVYGTALRLASKHEVAAEHLSSFLKENGGIEGCARQFRAEKHASSTKRVSTKGDDNTACAQTNTLTISGILGDMPDGTVTLIVSIAAGKATLVRIGSTPNSNTEEADMLTS